MFPLKYRNVLSRMPVICFNCCLICCCLCYFAPCFSLCFVYFWGYIHTGQSNRFAKDVHLRMNLFVVRGQGWRSLWLHISHVLVISRDTFSKCGTIVHPVATDWILVGDTEKSRSSVDVQTQIFHNIITHIPCSHVLMMLVAYMY